MDWSRRVTGAVTLLSAAGVSVLIGSSWVGSSAPQPTPAAQISSTPTAPLSQSAPVALAVAQSLPVPAGGREVSGTGCGVWQVVRCWEVPGDFATVNAAVVADLAGASRAEPQQTWHSTPTAGTPGEAARTSVDVDGHQVQVEVSGAVQGSSPDAGTTGVQTVVVSIDPV